MYISTKRPFPGVLILAVDYTIFNNQKVHPFFFKKGFFFVLVLLFPSVKRFSVFFMQNFFCYHQFVKKFKTKLNKKNK